MTLVRQKVFLILCFALFCFVSKIDAKSILLKNGRKITNVDVKPIANGFEITHKNGKKETVSLKEVQKIFISNDLPTKIRFKENQKDKSEITQISNQVPTRIPSDREKNFEEKQIPFVPKQKSGLSVFAEGLIPGWSRLVRNDSNSLKSLGFFLMFAELFLAYESYIYLSPAESVAKSSVNVPISPGEIAVLALNDTKLTTVLVLNRIHWQSSQIVLSNGRIMQQGLYEEEKRTYVSAFVFALILDAFLGYKFENWNVVPSLNVSFREREMSGGITVRF
ncbi:LA_0442/LA_0875 N-terminal domain-containing protein [Leptospira barantonii]|uniref:DNA-binding protein n=1 Tax=Leptospira barantonii TaxID=2023184 RepID=A0ABX4NQU5_9LEPT|nr:DNA-binding protein [Leptospira barantonii]PJZ59207.1 DNA-binding protein [Leptospira barantonii]